MDIPVGFHRTDEEVQENAVTVAIHEAGHVVADCFLFNAPDSVYISQEEDGIVRGNTSAGSWVFSVPDNIYKDGQPSKENLEALWKKGMVNLSGYAAEALMERHEEDWTVKGVIDFYNDTEEDDFTADLTKTTNFFLESRTIRFIMDDKEGKRLRWLAPYRKRIKSKNLSFEEVIMEDAVNFLRDKTHYIQNIADALLEKYEKKKWMGLLTKDEIISIMESTRQLGEEGRKA